MNKKTHCYQVLHKGPDSQIIKRRNASSMPLPGGRNLFPTYRDAKAHLRIYLQTNLDKWLESKRSLLAQTSHDLDFKPITDILDDRQPSKGSMKAVNGNPRSIWNEDY